VKATELRVTLVDPSLTLDQGMWGDPSGGWQPEGAAWLGRLAAVGVPYEVRATAAGEVDGCLVDPYDLTGVPGALSGGPPETAEETLQLLAERLGAVVVPDLRGTLVLRLDDPGAAVKEHLSSWAHPPMSAADWEALWGALSGFGRVSLFCCPGYVLADGSVVDSRIELPDEWQAMQAGVAGGLADLECHGFTHMHPDTAAWAGAPDRLDDLRWFRELWPPHLAEEPAVQAQAGRLRAWQEGTGRQGTSLVAPGEEWGLNTLAAAQHVGFTLFNSWGLCFLDRPVPTWTTGIGSPYLDEADPSWFGDCLPQIGYWHDRDMVINGPAWIGDQLEAWRQCGARRAISFADLAGAYAPIDAALVDGDVRIRSAPDVALRVVRR
jgi:hypothetical protein